jgi:hypothetical protein
MKDTPPDVERKYRELLLERSGADRLKMGCSMFATARALAVAAVREEEPTASPGRVRAQLFLRLYRDDFSEDERQRIVRRLIEGEPAATVAVAPRRVPVNWDDLEMALTSNAGEMSCYLDVRTGSVEIVFGDRFGDDVSPSAEDIDAGLAAGHLIHVEPLGSSVEYGWMAEFASSVRDGRLRDKLAVALDGRGAFRRFKNVLGAYPVERAQWFAFRDARLVEAAREWLAEQGIEPTTAPRQPPADRRAPRCPEGDR